MYLPFIKITIFTKLKYRMTRIDIIYSFNEEL